MVNLVLATFLFTLSLAAHEGPPYPILTDQVTSFGDLSIWTDPDVGEGTFLILLNPKAGAAVPLLVELKAQAKFSEETIPVHAAQRDLALEKQANRVAFVGKIPFSAEGIWRVHFELQNGETRFEIPLDVEVTPPGPSQKEFALYFLPFLLIGALWIKQAFKRRSVSH